MDKWIDNFYRFQEAINEPTLDGITVGSETYLAFSDKPTREATNEEREIIFRVTKNIANDRIEVEYEVVSEIKERSLL